MPFIFLSECVVLCALFSNSRVGKRNWGSVTGLGHLGFNRAFPALLLALYCFVCLLSDLYVLECCVCGLCLRLWGCVSGSLSVCFLFVGVLRSLHNPLFV